MGSEWDSRRALAGLDDRSQIPALAEQAKALCQPMDAGRLKQRLTALGMVMAPNRPPAEATMWLHEVSRLLSDIAEDVLCESLDTLQKRLKFLPTVAEVRELADPIMERRRREASRLDAMRRYLESGQPIGKLVQIERKPPVIDRRGEQMTEAETEELNRILEGLGACTRYRPDGSRFEVAASKRRSNERPPPRMPTRQDYIDMGVDPAVLDQIEAERVGEKQAAGASR